MKLSDKFDVRVKFKLECFEQELHATLKFEEGKFPTLEIDPLSGVSFFSVKLSDSEKQLITCKSEIHSYSLIGNEVRAGDIWPRYIIQGEEEGDLAGIEVVISGVSEWIDQGTGFNITDSEIKKDRPDTVFDEIIEVDGKRYQIRSNYNCSVGKKKNRDFLVSEYTSISIISLDEIITVQDSESLAHKARMFFSLILAVPLSIECIWLVNIERENRRPLYFASAKTESNPFQYPLECLIHPKQILQGIGWESLFLNYTSLSNRKNFNKIWKNLESLFSYVGTWDFKILGYVSILDSYCNVYVNKKGKKLDKKRYQNIKSELISIVDSHTKELGVEYLDIMSSFRDGVDAIRNTNLPTFRKKYDFMMSELDNDIRRIVNFTDDEFSTIKKIRDSAAHGLPIKTRYDRDISYEYRIKDKLQVLLIYLVYRDFGISSVEFSSCLKNTLCKFVRNANVDTVERDRHIGTIPFWKVDDKSFSYAKKFNSYVGVKYFKSSNTYKFSNSITQECKKWPSKIEPRYTNLIDHILAWLNYPEDVEVEFVSQAYFVNGNDTINLSGVCKVSYE